MTALDWIKYGLMGGVVVAPLWLAAGTYFRSGQSFLAFVESLVGGLLYATPFGAGVGVAMGFTVAGTELLAGVRLAGAFPVRKWQAMVVAACGLVQLTVSLTLSAAFGIPWWGWPKSFGLWW